MCFTLWSHGSRVHIQLVEFTKLFTKNWIFIRSEFGLLCIVEGYIINVSFNLNCSFSVKPICCFYTMCTNNVQWQYFIYKNSNLFNTSWLVYIKCSLYNSVYTEICTFCLNEFFFVSFMTPNLKVGEYKVNCGCDEYDNARCSLLLSTAEYFSERVMWKPSDQW